MDPAEGVAMRQWLTRLCLLGVVLGPLPAAAGTVIETEGAESGVNRILISEGRLRMESSGRVVLFDAGARRMTFVEPESRTYNTLGEQDIGKIARQLEQMRAQLERQLRHVPEDERAEMRRQIEQMLPGAGPQAGIRVEKTGGVAAVAGVSCREARIHRGGEPAREVCVAEPSDLGIPRADFETMLAMFGFFDDIAGAMGGDDAGMDAREMRRTMDELGGMPVRARGLKGGGAWEVRSVETRSIDAGAFEVPPGYREGGPAGQTSQ